MPTALVTCQHLQRHFGEFQPLYESVGVSAILPRIAGQHCSADEMKRLIVGVDGVIAGDDAIDASVLETGKASALKVVVKWGIGTDSIDKDAARRLGIPIFNTPGAFSDEVADVALSFLLMLARKTHLMHNSVVNGGWLKVEGRTLRGLTAGIIGLGSVGLGIARRVRALGMRVIGADVQEVPQQRLIEAGVDQMSFVDVLVGSDALFLACNLTAHNHHLLNEGSFARLRRGAYVINVSRGGLIDEAALEAALSAGHVSGAALDVFEVEPLSPMSRLRTFDTCVFGTHNGSNTKEAVAKVNQMSSDILLHALGLRPQLGFTPNRVA